MLIEREDKANLKRLAAQFPVVGITGPRQSGKTTLAKMCFPEKRYVSMDDIGMRRLAEADPNDFIAAFPEGAIIDEAQKLPELFDAIKLSVDSTAYAPGKFILTGSSQFRLRENMTDSMAGRAAFLSLLPFSISELDEGALLPGNPYDLIIKGQYPPLYDADKNFAPADWLDSYIDGYIDLDVKDQINPANLAAFKTFVRICALYSGQILSMDSISREVGVSAPTIKSWLSVLENSYIIHLLRPYSGNSCKALVKSPKLYFYDSGLLCRLLGIGSKEELLLSRHKGAVVETLAISELIKRRYGHGAGGGVCYYRDRQGLEVDALVEGEKTQAIEIKSGSSPDPKMSQNIKKYLNTAEDAEGIVFYLGDMDINVGGIRYLGWRSWSRFRLK